MSKKTDAIKWSRKRYINAILEVVVDEYFPDDEVNSPIVYKRKKRGDPDGKYHKRLLAELLERMVFEDKYIHRFSSAVNEPYLYSIPKKRTEKVVKEGVYKPTITLEDIFRNRKNEVDINDPKCRKYRETDPNNEEGIKRLFYIEHKFRQNTKNRDGEGSTIGYILKNEIREAILTLQSIFYKDYAGESIPTPTYTLPDHYRKEIGDKDIPTTIAINEDAIGGATEEIDFAIEITKKILDKNITIPYKVNNDIEKFYREEIGSPKSINSYHGLYKELDYIKSNLKALYTIGFTNSKIGNKLNPFLYQQYSEETKSGKISGRLYNTYARDGVADIQNMFKPIRNIVLSGMGYVDIDINNCHIEILNQFYKMVVGIKDDGLDYYCKNYKFKRIQIEKESEISPILVKKFIISLIYGGTFPTEKMLDGNSAKWIVDKVEVADEFIMHHGNERDGIESLKKLIQSKTLIECKNIIQHALKEIKLVSKTKNIYGGYGKDNVYINPRYRIATIENKQNSCMIMLDIQLTPHLNYNKINSS